MNETIKSESKIEKTGIFGIDNILEYMRCEAENKDITFNFKLNGNINYNGAVRPQLSVDRKEIVSYPCNYKQEYKEITEKDHEIIVNIRRS